MLPSGKTRSTDSGSITVTPSQLNVTTDLSAFETATFAVTFCLCIEEVATIEPLVPELTTSP